MATIDEKLIKFETKNPGLDLKKKLKNPEEFWFSEEVLKFVNTLFKFEYDYFKYIEMDSTQFEELKKIVKDDIWEDKKYYKVLEYFEKMLHTTKKLGNHFQKKCIKNDGTEGLLELQT